MVKRQAREAEKAGFAYGGIISPQMDWLTGRVLSISPEAPELGSFKRAARDYGMRAVLVRLLPDHDNRTDAAFEEGWKKETAARQALIDEVKALAELQHPPRRRGRDKAQTS